MQRSCGGLGHCQLRLGDAVPSWDHAHVAVQAQHKILPLPQAVRQMPCPDRASGTGSWQGQHTHMAGVEERNSPCQGFVCEAGPRSRGQVAPHVEVVVVAWRELLHHADEHCRGVLCCGEEVPQCGTSLGVAVGWDGDEDGAGRNGCCCRRSRRGCRHKCWWGGGEGGGGRCGACRRLATVRACTIQPAREGPARGMGGLYLVAHGVAVKYDHPPASRRHTAGGLVLNRGFRTDIETHKVQGPSLPLLPAVVEVQDASGLPNALARRGGWEGVDVGCIPRAAARVARQLDAELVSALQLWAALPHSLCEVVQELESRGEGGWDAFKFRRLASRPGAGCCFRPPSLPRLECGGDPGGVVTPRTASFPGLRVPAHASLGKAASFLQS